MKSSCLLLLLFGASLSGGWSHQQHPNVWESPETNPRAPKKQPVIFDTDVGSFIDDSFAIVYAAQSLQLDIKLIVTCTDDTTARAKVAAKLLKILGRDDIPIGIGIKNENQTHHYLFDWAWNEDLSEYKGGVYQDGVKKMAEVLSESDEIVDIIAIGPMTNFPQLVQRYPESVKKARIRAMAGSIYVGYDGDKPPAAEYNVDLCPWCMEVLLKSDWNVTITPLDTCGNVALDGSQLEQVLEADNKASLALESTLMFYCIANESPQDHCDFKAGTPVLYDVVATLLAMPTVAVQFLDFAAMQLTVNETGFTVVDEMHGINTSVALQWRQQGEKGFTDMLANLYSL